MDKNKPSYKFWPVLGLISGIGIAQQIVLVRIFSIGQWYHFAYLVVSIAMLGIALAGTAAALFGSDLTDSSEKCFRLLSTGLPLGLWFSYEFSQRIPFEGIEIVAEPHQWLYAGVLYLVLALPFFFVAGFVTISFMEFRKYTGTIYGVNLAGSGLGALLITIGMYFYEPVTLIYLLIGCGLAAGGLLVFRRRAWLFFYLIILMLLIGQLNLFGPTGLYISQYKPISYAQRGPGVSRVAGAVDPLARVEVLKSPRFRETHGQLSGYPYEKYGSLPEQRGLFFDGSGPEPVHHFTGDTEPFHFLDYVPSAVGFKIADSDSLLILGAGGGTGILEGIYRGYGKITAVEASSSVKDLLRGELFDFSGGIIDYPPVNWIHAVPRRFAAKSEQYSHVYLPPAGGYPGAGFGTQLLNENYKLTVRGVENYLDSLDKKGVLNIATWVREPPRSLIRLVATVVEAAENQGYEEPFGHLGVLRSWNLGVVVFTNRSLEGERLVKMKQFADDRGFDLDYFPGQSPGASPRYVKTGKPTHSRLIFKLKDNREDVYSNYEYNIRPTTDNRPYFYHFFRPWRLWELLKEFDFQRYPHTEWGFLLVLVTLVQSLVGGIILVVLPLYKRSIRKLSVRMPGMGIYFGFLGLAYMAVEVALIQRLMLILHYPVYSVAVILAGLLVFSGLGSYISEKLYSPQRRIIFSILGIAGYLALLQPIIDWLAAAAAGWPGYLAIFTVLLFLFPLGFCMGIPFPGGLSLIKDKKREARVAWAWAVNGATSVIGAILAGLIALLGGFYILFIFGGIMYLLAGICARITWDGEFA